MHFQDDEIIGIVGGMGPEAGIALFNRILKSTDAKTDQEHHSVILMSLPKHVPDRSRFLQGEIPINPARAVIEIILKLEQAGARVIGIACNTCHVSEIFDVVLEELDKLQSTVKVVNMPEETCRYLKHFYPTARRIGLMATNGTYRS